MSSMARTEWHHAAAPHKATRGLFARLLTRWQRERTRAALESLSDALLKDIGITRSEIPYIAASLTAPTPRKETPERKPAPRHTVQMEAAR